ncbi:phosphatase PAP2 family protein [Nonomuraea sp. NPDC000554]|uniref:phosphatase PAP2 family protein n=1 Tax=Nonomuraea sp. NPDC000554 TaxID=3154259 RepID=UPI003318A908
MTVRKATRGGLSLWLTVASLVAFAVLVVLVETAFEPLRLLDQGVASGLHAYARREPGLTGVLAVWTAVFGPGPWRAAVLLCAAFLVYRGASRPAFWAVITITVGGLLGIWLKVLVGRARPYFPDPVAVATDQAFPSGHALNATLGAGVLVLVILPALRGRPRLRALAWCVAGFLVLSVAYTRIALGVHWVSDVVGGVLLGVLVIAATTAGFEAWRRDLGRPSARPLREAVEAADEPPTRRPRRQL